MCRIFINKLKGGGGTRTETFTCSLDTELGGGLTWMRDACRGIEYVVT